MLILRSDQNTIIHDILIVQLCWRLKFLCAWVSNISGILGKTRNLKVSLNTFVAHPEFTIVLKTSKKFLSNLKILSSSSSESTNGLTNPVTWEVFSYENGFMKLYVKSSRFKPSNTCFRTIFFMALSVWVIRGFQVFIQKIKNLLLKKYL